MKIDRETLLSELTVFALGGNGIVIGRPGAGKSFALAELRQRLKTKSVPHLFLAVERLGAASPAEIATVLQRDGDFISLLRQAVGNAGPGVLIFDGFDAARGERERAGILDLITRAVVELRGLWHIIVSVRTFDAKKSQRLLDLFAERNTSSVVVGCRQFDIPLLTTAEVDQALTQIVGLRSLYDNGTNEFRELLKVPFHLWLIEQVLKDGAQTEDFSNVTSEVHLLEMYWKRRVQSGPFAADKEYIVQRVALEMVERHTLTVPRDRVYVPQGKADWDSLLSDEVLTEVAIGQVAFTHNILFDFAVSVHLLERDPKKLADFVATEPARPLFLRPSLLYHFTRLWHFDREQFWRNYWTVVQHGEAHVRQIVRLVLPAVVVSEAVNLADLKPLLDHARSGKELAADAIAFVLQALRVLKTTKVGLWASFLAQTEFPIDRRYAWDAGIVARFILEMNAVGPAVRGDIGQFGRRLLSWAWSDRKSADYGKWLERLAGLVAVPLVALTFATDRGKSRRLLEDVVQVVDEPDFPIDTIFRLVLEVPHLIPEDPVLVGTIYERIFGHDELSDEKTNMGGPVLPLISNRRQDYDSCRYSLTEEFPNFLATAPHEAVRVGLRAVQAYVFEDRLRYRGKKRAIADMTEDFWFRGQKAHYIQDGSSIWDEGLHPDQEMSLADLTFDWLGEAAAANRTTDLDYFLNLMTTDVRVASLWARLLETGAKHSESLGVQLWELALAEPIRNSEDTRHALGVFLEQIAGKLSPEKRQQLEVSILAIPENVEPEHRERAERRRNRLLARLPKDLLVNPEAVLLQQQLAAVNALPDNQPPFRMSASWEGDTDEAIFRQAGIKPETPSNAELRSLYQPLQQWSDKGKNEPEIDGLMTTVVALRDRLKQETSADEMVVATAVTHLAMFASDALLKTTDAALPRFEILRDLVLTFATHPDPKPNATHDAQWSSAVWSPAPRIESAQALPWLTHFARDESALHAIGTLISDPVPAVRFLLISSLAQLGEYYADKMWPLLERVVETEQNPVVLQGLTRVLFHTMRQDRAKTGGLVQQLLRSRAESDDNDDGKAETNLVLIVTDMAVVFNEPWAKETLKGWRETPVVNATSLAVSGRRLVAYLKPQSKTAHFGRAQTLLLMHLEAVAQGLAEIQKSAQFSREEAQKKMRQLYGVIDEAVMRTYFAADVDEKLKQRGEFPLDDSLRENFFRDSLPVLKRILAFGQNVETGMLLAPTAHYFMELLNGVLRYDPPLVLEMAAQVVGSSKRFNYNLDSIALRETVKLVEALLTDHRHSIQEPASIGHLLGLLDSFVDAGWPEALQLVWRLDEVYR